MAPIPPRPEAAAKGIIRLCYLLPKVFSVSESQAAVPSHAGVVAGKATPTSRRPEHPSPPQDMVTLPGRAGP